MTSIFSKTDLPDNSGQQNLLKFTGLTPKQRDLLMKGSLGVVSIAGAGALITSLSSATSVDSTSGNSLKIHETAPVATDVSNHSSFDSAFSHARAEVGAGGIFTWNGKDYNTYYKEEWDAMSSVQKNNYLESIAIGQGNNYSNHECQACSTIEIPTEFEIAKGVNDSMSFQEAFATARQECGSKGLFNYHGNTFNTLTKEEYEVFSNSEKQELASNIQNSTQWTTLHIDNTEEGTAYIHESNNIINQNQEHNHLNEHNLTEVANQDHLDSNTHYVTVDANHDSIPEIVVADVDNDNFADIIVSDENGNQTPDVYLVNVDHNQTLETMIMDVTENGIDEFDTYYNVGENSLNMEDIDQHNVQSDLHLGSNDHLALDNNDLDSF